MLLTMASKLRDRVAKSETEQDVSKLRDRLPSATGQGGTTSTRDIKQVRARKQAYKEYVSEQNRLANLYDKYVEAYEDYNTTFETYKKERDEYADAISEWKDEQTRKKEKQDFEQTAQQLLKKTEKLEAASKARFGTVNEDLLKFKESLVEESSEIPKVEEENKQRITKLDVETSELLKPFTYYEGLGFATGDIKSSDYNIVEGSGVGSFYYGSGEYEKYDPATGQITKLKANPQSKYREVLATVNGQTVDPEQLDDLNPTADAEVIGEDFNYANYKDNANYDIVRDAQGNVTEIKAKPKTYTRYKDRDSKQYGSYIPEVIKVKNGKVVSWTKYDDYKTDWDRSSKSRAVMTDEQILYDEYGLKKVRNQYKDKTSYPGAKSNTVVNTLTEEFKDGAQTKRIYRNYFDGDVSTQENNYLTGKYTVRDRNGNVTTNEGSFVELPQGEEAENLRKFLPLPNVDTTEQYRTAKEGEAQKMTNVSFSDSTGKFYTVQVPAFNAPSVLGTQEAYFGTMETAQNVLSSVPYAERPSNVPLRNYKAQVFEDIARRRAEIAASRPFVTVENPTTGKKFIIQKPKKLTEAQKQGQGILGSNVSWGQPAFTQWEKSSQQRVAEIKKQQRPIIGYSSVAGKQNVSIFNPDKVQLPRWI